MSRFKLISGRLYDVRLVKHFVSGTLEGTQVADIIRNCSLETVSAWRRHMHERKVIEPVKGFGTSAYVVADVSWVYARKPE